MINDLIRQSLLYSFPILRSLVGRLWLLSIIGQGVERVVEGGIERSADRI